VPESPKTKSFKTKGEPEGTNNNANIIIIEITAEFIESHRLRCLTSPKDAFMACTGRK